MSIPYVAMAAEAAALEGERVRTTVGFVANDQFHTRNIPLLAIERPFLLKQLHVSRNQLPKNFPDCSKDDPQVSRKAALADVFEVECEFGDEVFAEEFAFDFKVHDYYILYWPANDQNQI